MIAMINQKNTNKMEIMAKFYELYQGVYGGQLKVYKEKTEMK